MKYLLLLLPLTASAQCVTPVDTMVAGECNYVIESPPILPGQTITRCYALISESDNFNPGYMLVQTPACGPLAYQNLSYEVFSEDCSTSIASGSIFPIPVNPTAYLPDTSVNYIACFTYTAVCELTATCPTYGFSPLPIRLLSFSGKAVGDMVQLKWVTGSEAAASHFILRRSTDLHEWKNVWVVAAKGFSYTPIEYSAVDRVPVSGAAYYRLTEVDLDGSQSTFDMIAVYYNGGTPTKITDYFNVLGQEK